MTVKRIFGFIFIVIGLVMFLVIIGLLPSVFRTLVGLLQLVSGTLDSYEAGKATGRLLYWIVHSLLTYFLFFYGRKWIKTKEK